MGYLLTSLDAAMVTGPGTALIFDTPRLVAFSAEIIWGGSPSSANVILERSFDGVNFNVFSEQDFPGPTNPFIVEISSTLMYIVRARLLTLSGGTSPAVTVILAAVEIE